MADNSDYTKPHMKLFELLPEVYKSDANKALFANLFNRYLTKQETERVAGYVGQGNPNAVISRQIHEVDLHRQAFQLQPILYNKVGSVEWMSSWKDILKEAERQGIEESLIQDWLSLLKFNWAPPIDIDKLIHYQDYYWYDENDSSSQPQYITIRSRCSTAQANVAFYERLTEEFGTRMEIDEIRSSLYSGTGYDTLLIVGDYGRLYEEGFEFYVVESPNAELNDSFWTVVESEYKENEGKTHIRINTILSTSVAGGYMSLEEQLTIANIAVSCQCSSSVGWDVLPWDDNPQDPAVWDTGVLYTDPCGDVSIDFDTWLDHARNPGPPPAGMDCGIGQMWYDESANALYQYGEETGWKLIQSSFSSIIPDITGSNLWDSTLDCGIKSAVKSADQWIDENKWLHKLDVPNFSIAKQASVPIIEYDWDLELNEWTYTNYEWKYRSSKSVPFEVIGAEPEYLEYVPLENYELEGLGNNTIVLDDRYGDLTSYFTPGRQFLIVSVSQILVVEESSYATYVVGEPMNTRIVTTEAINFPPSFVPGDISNGTGATIDAQPAPLRPQVTSQGDPWKGFHEQWILTENETTLPTGHQPANPLAKIDLSVDLPMPDPSGNYATVYNSFAQYYEIRNDVTNDTFILANDIFSGTSKTLRTRALLGTNNVRVYVNDIRQYGTYIEQTAADLVLGPDTDYVAGIKFDTQFIPSRFDEVLIEVGEATLSDTGRSEVEVRMAESDVQYGIDGLHTKNLIKYRKEEQVKTRTNQYPLFDLYNVDGSSAFQATPIFEYVTDTAASVNLAIGMRLKTDGENNFVFKQTLLENDNGVMYAYRDYFNQEGNIWVDTDNNKVYFWYDTCWFDKVNVNGYYISAIVSDIAPISPLDGAYWLDTLNHILKVYDIGIGDWTEIPALYQADDPSLQTIWKKGLNDETYIPEKVDWKRRSETEYYEEKSLFVEERTEEIIAADGSLSIPEAVAQANDEWKLKESNQLTDSYWDGEWNGEWFGDWELPDPLYYNHAHENRKELSLSEIVTHFNSIIDAQPKVPGYTGPAKGMFHLIQSNSVNYGLGGTIREYQYGFDTFLSSLFVNEVSPRSLFNFAHDQYEVLLNTLKEIYRESAVDMLTDLSDDALEDRSEYISNRVIQTLEQNDQLAQVYGDSTAFTDNQGSNDLGVRNWIATLPFFCLAQRHAPSKVSDADRGLNHIVHHDGHREDYFLADATVGGIVYGILNTDDPRVSSGKIGISSTVQPPNDADEFEISYNTPIGNRIGVYWYHSIDGGTLYRLAPLSVGLEVPDDSAPNGSTWLDLTPGDEVLRIKTENEYTGEIEWVPAPGLTPGTSPIKLHNGSGDNDTATVSAWEVIDLNEILRDIVFEVETRLYEAAPDCSELKYDYSALQEQYPTKYNEYLEEQYLAFAREREIVTPFSNTLFDQTNPFTWNYKYSTHGRGFPIVDVDLSENAFVVEGDFEAIFNPCLGLTPPANCATTGVEVTFYIKNNGANDGKWVVFSTSTNPGATYDIGSGLTTIKVSNLVEDMIGGVIYTGILPSSSSTGAESGGDWRDVYEKFYNTPFPHLEPWKLQGYDDKPTWWDDTYLNDDPTKWGTRRWKYRHGFDIRIADAVENTFVVDGDFRELFHYSRGFPVDGGSVHDGSYTVDSIGAVAGGTPGPAGSAIIEIAGDNTNIFIPEIRFSVEDASGNLKQMLTVESSYYTGPPFNHTLIFVKEGIEDLTDYDIFGGSTFDRSTNQTTIRIIEPVTSSTVDEGRIAIHYGMWYNIMQGRLPPGVAYPNGVIGVTGDYQDISIYQLPVSIISTYNYMSVNIDNDVITAGGEYYPDELFPPYWDFSAHFGTGLIPSFDSPLRSLYYLYTTEIVSPSADYIFGDAGPYEWLWRSSSQFLYDQMVIAFRLDPVRFIYTVFGPEYHTISGLFVDKRLERVLSHAGVDFHGDLVDNELLQIDGINQWYVNYLRYSDFDISMSDFRSMWAKWTAPMMYQFASFIDTPSLDVGHRQICVSDFDYRVASKRSPGVEDYWLDSFNINILQAPPKVARQDNEYAWKLSLTTKTPFSNVIQYYGVQNYQFYADPDTDLCTLFSWPVSNINFFSNTFTIKGDQTELFSNGDSMEFVECSDPAVDATYTVEAAVYNQVTDTTIVEIQESLPGTTANDGRIILDNRKIPWQTGENIVLSSYGFLPAPLRTDNLNGVYEYFIIRESDNTFRLALSGNEAEQNSYVNITSITKNDLFVGKIQTTFTDGVQGVLWRHYALDENQIRSFIPPYEFKGLQELINIVDGYEEYSINQGWRFNLDNTIRDPSNTSLSVNWQHELIRFLGYAYNVRLNNTKVGERYPVTVDASSDVWTLADVGQPPFITGDPVAIMSDNRVYPPPLFQGGRYYMIRDSLTTFRLAATKSEAAQGIAIDITTTAGTRDLYLVAAKTLRVSSASFEINPFRTAVWFRPERGIVSNMLKGPTDSFASHVLVDQYGRAVTQDNIRVYREDKETKISHDNGVSNDVELTKIYGDPYNFIHLGASHLFVDTYEHVLVFNDETTAGQLLYDPFLGLNITKFELLFNRQTEFTQRPNVGGQYLSTFFNQGADLDRNIEASIEDLRNLYDTYRVIEANELVNQGRKSIGYVKDGTHFDNMNLNEKSQFIFWRGQIQHKGAMTSIHAFINSRRFIDAKIDEYWAIKVGEFGSDLEKEYIEMWLSTDDARDDDMFLQFLGEDAICDSGYAANAFDSECGYSYPNAGDSLIVADDGWTGINITDQDRWYNFPNQQQALRDNAGLIYFDLTPVDAISIAFGTEPTSPNPNDGWIEEIAGSFYFRRWDGVEQVWDSHGSWGATDEPVLRHDMKADLVTVTAKIILDTWNIELYNTGYYDATGSDIAPNGRSVSIPEYAPNTNMLKVFAGTGIGDAFAGQELVINVDYAEELQSGFYSDKLLLASHISSPVIRIVYGTSTFTKDVHYELYNTNIIKFLFPEMVEPVVQDMKLWGWIFDKSALNPHSIIDVKSDTVITRMQVWDPARGWHYYNADHIIDMKLDVDPAFYSESPVNDDDQLKGLSQQITVPIPNDGSRTAEQYWGRNRVGVTRLDTNHLDYIPYYDSVVIPNIDDRLLVWGSLADWSDIKIYTWVESDVPPEQWNDIASVEEGNLTIPQQLRKSGRTFQTTFKDDGGAWVVANDEHETFDPIIDDPSITVGDTTFTFTTDNIDPQNSTVKVFVNGQVIANSRWSAISSSEFEVYGMTQASRVELVDFVPGADPTLDDETNEANIAAAVEAGTHLQEYQYSVENYIDNLDQERFRYYFWVEDKGTKGDRLMSPQNAQSTMINFPIPYVVYQDVQPSGSVTFDGDSVILPARFQRAVLRGLRTVVDDNNRYIVRWTRDFTLRDQLSNDSLEKKNLHEQWDLIRREMPYHVPRWLWDKVTESIVGYKLTNPTERVPSYQRELYDTEYESDTQYGIGSGQSFTDGDLALETIVRYLNDPDNDFAPVDINVFFDQNSFDTNENIIAAMNNIYNSFPFLHVNAIWFDTLLDAFSKKSKYEDIFKTSMIAVHGIRPFQVGGLFDD